MLIYVIFSFYLVRKWEYMVSVRNIMVLFFILSSTYSIAQVRNGWRSIYDKEGRLSRMNYYQDGKVLPDSNLFIQYHLQNLPKGIVSGEIQSGLGCIKGTVKLFGLSGDLESFHIKRNDELVFDLDCDNERNCAAVWFDSFEHNSGFWEGEDHFFESGNLVLENRGAINYAIYNPEIPIELENAFACKVVIPVENNNARQGIAFGWKDVDNYYLFEVLFGKYYSIQYFTNGESIPVTEGRNEIKVQNPDKLEVVITKNDRNLIFELNGNVELVLPTPDCRCSTMALVTRARGKALFDSFLFKYALDERDTFFSKHWMGVGTGFFISTDGKIMTTYDVVKEAKNIRIAGMINGEKFALPASIVQIDESANVAVLQLKGEVYNQMAQLPYGFTDLIPNADCKIFSMGFPNAIGGIYLDPEVFEGKVLPGEASYPEYRLLEMPYRYGMNGAPVFDNDANLIGICANKGLDLINTEIIDFHNNSNLLKSHMGYTEQKIDAPVKNMDYQQKLKVLSESVVIVESSLFSFPEE